MRPERFKPGDGVYIIPKFAHLYSDVGAVVIEVRADPYRPMFNEYTLEFRDGSIARMLEFQIIEAAPGFETLIASCTFDSQQNEGTSDTRGQMTARRVLLETPAFHIDMRIRMVESRRSLLGQILQRETNNELTGIGVRLLREAMPVNAAVSDSLGVFEFAEVPQGSLNIVIAIPQHSTRIFGTFWA